MTGILAKQLFLHPSVPERAADVRVHAVRLGEAVEPTTQVLCLLEGAGLFRNATHA